MHKTLSVSHLSPTVYYITENGDDFGTTDQLPADSCNVFYANWTSRGNIFKTHFTNDQSTSDV